jgi:oxygen-independent coproporphyrinogen III oxidase
MSTLAEVRFGAVYAGYSYSYPHKTAYRRFQPPLPLDEVWAEEPRDSLFLYVHIPFCEMRCGFCNLFTQAQAEPDLVAAYLDTLRRQAQVVRRCVGEMRFARCSIGGGTPTWLNARELENVLDLIEQLGADLHAIPVSVETSPETALPDRLKLLRRRGIDRISIGVQSFVEDEVHAIGRPQTTAAVTAALSAIREEEFPILNIDLMYGLPGQTTATWLTSLREALAYEPEELYLYPLYVRPLTALGRRGDEWNDKRLDLYRDGREFLLAKGYLQCSMRRFRSPRAPAEAGPAYSCQSDGMLGLGCGARSYTRQVHYAGDYAVDRAIVRNILARWVGKEDHAFGLAEYGYRLDLGDRKRRYVLQSMLETDGLDPAAYRQFFRSDVRIDFPEMAYLEDLGWVQQRDRMRLTALGLERSDQIGPWLYSPRVRRLMEDHDAR